MNAEHFVGMVYELLEHRLDLTPSEEKILRMAREILGKEKPVPLSESLDLSEEPHLPFLEER